jgi:capsular exopolysaccharide synthesis family protein
MPEICGIVCPHEAVCQGACVRNKRNEPVVTGAIEAFVTEYQRQHGTVEIPVGEKSGKKVALESGKNLNNSTLQLQTASEKSPLSTLNLDVRDMRTRESYRSLCASLLLSKAEKPASCILITSAIPREGKTTTSANLGVTLAETGAPTLLIDSDFRNPSLSGRFGAVNGKGLSVHLAGGEIDIRETELPNLYILPAGPTPPNPVALFTASRFSETLARLRQRFQFILIDSPPVLSLAESSIIASKVDGVILVVKAADTPTEIVTRANTQLIRSGACVLGAAVNHLDLRHPEYSYFSKYYFDERYADPPGGHGHDSGSEVAAQ